VRWVSEVGARSGLFKVTRLTLLADLDRRNGTSCGQLSGLELASVGGKRFDG